MRFQLRPNHQQCHIAPNEDAPLNAATAKIIGSPTGFNLQDSLRDAKAVTLLMAFAKKSGWESIKDALISGNTQVEILVGLNFAITDPAVLSAWLKLKQSDPYRYTIEVAPPTPMFHPKVIFVERADASRFAIVGSGNLTGGGLSTNIECGVFVNDEAQLDELAVWQSQLAGDPLDEEIIDDYRGVYKESVAALWRVRRSASKLNRLLGRAKSRLATKPIPAWDVPGFLTDMDKCLVSDEGIVGLENRKEGAKLIHRLLDMPEYNFDKPAWEEFYGVVEFGRIRQSYKSMSHEVAKLRKTLRLLTSNQLDKDTLQEILAVEGKFHVRGLGTNLVSKVLTVHDRQRWPLFNERVKKTLEQYGHRADWGAKNYLEFAGMMRRVLSRKGKPDFWAMDVFCEVRSRGL
jgi:hypothetical protein